MTRDEAIAFYLGITGAIGASLSTPTEQAQFAHDVRLAAEALGISLNELRRAAVAALAKGGITLN